MPILQSRMIALIDAALDYQHAYTKLSYLIHTTYNSVEQGNADPMSALQELALMTNDHNFLEDAGRSQSTINQEHYHFKRNLARNVREREYQETKRGTPRTREHFEPHYAKEEFGALARRLTAFRAPNQNKRGDIPKQKDHTPREPSEEAKREINKEIERFDPLSNTIPKGEDLKISDTVIDPNFPEGWEKKGPFGDL